MCILISGYQIQLGKWWPAGGITKSVLRYPILCKNILKYTKMYLTYMIHTFWGIWSILDLRYLNVDHLDRIWTKIYGKQDMPLSNKFYCAWLSCWGFRQIFSARYCPFFVDHGYAWKEWKIIFSWYSISLSILERNFKKGDFIYEGILHKKIINKDVYADYSAIEDILQDVCSLRQYGDLIALTWCTSLKF